MRWQSWKAHRNKLWKKIESRVGVLVLQVGKKKCPCSKKKWQQMFIKSKKCAIFWLINQSTHKNLNHQNIKKHWNLCVFKWYCSMAVFCPTSKKDLSRNNDNIPRHKWCQVPGSSPSISSKSLQVCWLRGWANGPQQMKECSLEKGPF